MAEEHRLIFQILEEVEFFDGFNTDELWKLVETADWVKAVPGEKICTSGELDLHMFVLVEGEAEVIFGSKLISLLTTGDSFGEFGLMGERRSADVVAKTRCLLLRFNAERLNSLPVPMQIRLLKRIIVSLLMRLQNVNRHIFWKLPAAWK
ncbi:MAG: cyclic nucleotide-binding domain-containing protein [Deltaproteobacteria bacterium]|nr:cyclic nucleotide-binding domain-containing protein [Deltaproteobacteria bacterium]